MNSDVLRLIDANANRAREALRVMEDFARFVLDDKSLSGDLKTIRHRFSIATATLCPDAIFHRDTAGDVGTTNKTSTEQQRGDVNDVVTAAGKRMGEALRAIEEFAKTIDPKTAAEIEKVRYAFYDIEKRVAFTLRPVDSAFRNVRLYVLITESLCKKPWFDVAKQAVRGGADCIQLREKDLDGGELLRRARKLVDFCRRKGKLVIINDRIDIAMLADADGVHLGQTDLPATQARKLLGRGKIIGVSTHNIDQARQAVLDGADYIGVGPVFPSLTKPRDFLPGLDYARQVAEKIRIPAVAIAGITLQNVDKVLATGIHTVAVTAAVVSQPDPHAAAKALRKKLNHE